MIWRLTDTKTQRVEALLKQNLCAVSLPFLARQYPVKTGLRFAIYNDSSKLDK